MDKNDLINLGRVLPTTGKIHQNQDVWSTGGVSPTIKATVYKEVIKIMEDNTMDKILLTANVLFAGGGYAREGD